MAKSDSAPPRGGTRVLLSGSERRNVDRELSLYVRMSTMDGWVSSMRSQFALPDVRWCSELQGEGSDDVVVGVVGGALGAAVAVEDVGRASGCTDG